MLPQAHGLSKAVIDREQRLGLFALVRRERS